jgi:hypothetical protein
MRLLTWANAAGSVCLLTGLSNLLSATTKTGAVWYPTVAIGTAYLCLAILHFRYSGRISFYATLVVALAALLPLPSPAHAYAACGALLCVVVLTLVTISRALFAKEQPNIV